MSNLEKHADAELRRAGLFDKDSDYGGMLGESVMALVRVFAAQGHSGLSAHITMDIFQKVAARKALTPLTPDPSEWKDVTEHFPSGDPPMWQNIRQTSCFSSDGGKTYFDVDAGDGNAIHQTTDAVRVTETLTVTPRPA